jgi:hypothetical protein
VLLPSPAVGGPGPGAAELGRVLINRMHVRPLHRHEAAKKALFAGDNSSNLTCNSTTPLAVRRPSHIKMLPCMCFGVQF